MTLSGGGYDMDSIFGFMKRGIQSSMTLYENMLRGQINKIKNLTRKLNTKIRKTFQSMVSYVFGKPTSLKDYFMLSQWYVSKRFLGKLAVITILAVLFLKNVAFPFLEGRVWPASVVVNSTKFHELTGKAKVYDKKGGLLYQGKLKDGAADGTGEVYQNHQLIYKGDMKDNLYEGKGTLYQNGMVKYKGGFGSNLYEGEGALYYDNGSLKFQGTFEQGNLKKGVEYYANGMKKYSGEYTNGLFSGFASFYDKSKENKLIYSGNYKEGKKNGYGKLYQSGSLLYDGEFLNNLYQGNGKLFCGGKLWYDGQFVSSKMNGIGSLYSLVTGKMVYQGNFQNGVYEKTGKCFDDVTGRMIYDGEFSNGFYDGKGILYSKSGQKLYEGTFFKGQIDYMQFCKADADTIQKAFGKEDTLELFENQFMSVYEDLSVIFTFDFAEGQERPTLSNMKFLGEQNINGVYNGEPLKSIKRKLGKEGFTSYEFVVGENEAFLSKWMDKDFSEGDVLYCTKYNFDDYYIRMYSDSPDGAVWYFEIGVI